MECIFCHKDSSSSKSIEHIIPESLGNKHHVLLAGYVCDECNHYFAIKIEKELLAQPYFISMRFRNEILTKKGKLVKEKMIFPDALKSCEVTMQTTNDGLIASLEDKELYRLIKSGKTRTMIAPYIPAPESPNTIMSRFLTKCAYEYFLYNMGEDKYNLCVQELLGSEVDIFDADCIANIYPCHIGHTLANLSIYQPHYWYKGHVPNTAKANSSSCRYGNCRFIYSCFIGKTIQTIIFGAISKYRNGKLICLCLGVIFRLISTSKDFKSNLR